MSGTRVEFFKCQGGYRNQASEVHSLLVRQAYNSVSCNGWPGGVNSDLAHPAHPHSETCLFFGRLPLFFSMTLNITQYLALIDHFLQSLQDWRRDARMINNLTVRTRNKTC